MSAAPRVPGSLRVFLGTAPGSGKTYTMVQEGHRLAATRDVIVAACDALVGSPTAHALAGLETLTPSPSATTGGVDVDTVLSRGPQVVLVDRLAHPGRKHAVLRLLEAGIDVITTVDVTEIASLSDAVEAITGTVAQHTVPDEMVEQAATLHLVDAAPRKLQPRTRNHAPSASGGEATDWATVNALRQIALLWLAERLDTEAPVAGPHHPDEAAGHGPQRDDFVTPLPRVSRYLAAQPSGWRLRAAWVITLLGPPVLTTVLLAPPVHLDLQLIVPLFLALVVGVALLGGLWPALLTAAVSSAGLNWFFTPPRQTWIIHDPQDVAAILVFVLIATAVASVVHRNVQRTNQALQAQRETTQYADLATSLLGNRSQLDLLLRRALDTFHCDRAAVVRRQADGILSVQAEAESSDPPVAQPQTTRVRIDAWHELVLEGRELEPAQRRLLRAYAAAASAIFTRLALQASTTTARTLERDNLARTALLSAVSHDLRTPLASIKAAASGLLDPTVVFSEDDHRQLLETIDESSDQLDALIRDLLDVSRLHQGSLVAHPTTIALTEALPSRAWPARVHVSPTLSTVTVLADRPLLERVLANLVDNSLAHAGIGSTVTLSAAALDDRVRLLVRDDGPGVPAADRPTMFEPFQRRGDATSGHVGLGLAISRGLVEAMGGSITATQTTGGGLTLVLDLPAGAPSPSRRVSA